MADLGWQIGSWILDLDWDPWLSLSKLAPYWIYVVLVMYEPCALFNISYFLFKIALFLTFSLSSSMSSR